MICQIERDVDGPKELSMENDKFIKVSIFMNVFNCHVNRFPIDCKVNEVFYKPGDFVNASMDDASTNNERNLIKITSTLNDEIAVVQVAGLVARRIISYCNNIEDYKQGQRFGIIRFGSRVDLFFKNNFRVLVKKGQTVIGGETLIASREVLSKNEKIDFRVALPNLITIIGLCLGLNSLKLAFEGNFEKALIFIVLASIVDALDGRIARLIKGTSKFGAELDSLTDFVNFGVCPVIILYFWILNDFGFYGWIISLIFIVSGCLRLARFNIDSETKGSWEINFFTGIPVPAGAGLILLPMIINFSSFNEYFDIKPIFILLVVIFVSYMMISRVPTYAIKQIKISKTIFIFLALGFVLFLVFYFKILMKP